MEGLESKLVEENLIKEEGDLIMDVVALKSSIDSVNDDLEKKGYSEGNGSTESVGEMQIQISDEKKINFVADTQELGVETSNSCPIIADVGVKKEPWNEVIVGNERLESREEKQIQAGEEMKITSATERKELSIDTSKNCSIISNDGGKKRVYSRSELEALRDVRVMEQKEKWLEIYNDLGPDLSREYDSLGNSANKKHLPSTFKSQGQPTGRRGKTNMTKVNHEMEVTDISNSSHSRLRTEDTSIFLDEEYSQYSDSDEDYDGILKPAFHVEGKPNFESGPPEDGWEYLRRVRWEASKIPKVKIAKLDRSKVNKTQSDYMPKIPDIAKCPDHLLPSKEWEELFLAEFEKLRLAFSCLPPSSFSNSDACSGTPTVSTILGMEPVTRVSMLRRCISSFNNLNTLSHDNSAWLFSLCATVDIPLDADTCASLRCLLRKCASLRAEKREVDDEVIMLNILATISGKYFRQLDS